MNKTEHATDGTVESLPADEIVDRPRLGTTPERTARAHPIGRMIGLALAGIVLLLAMNDSRYGWYHAFLDFPAVGIVLGCTLGLLLGMFGWRGFRAAIRTLFGGSTSTHADERATVLFRFGAGFALGSGFLGMMIGFIRMLSRMEDPSRIGAGMAVCILSQFYGVILAMLMCLAAGIVSQRGASTKQLGRMATGSVLVAGGIGATGVVTTLALVSIILISMGGP